MTKSDLAIEFYASRKQYKWHITREIILKTGLSEKICLPRTVSRI